MAEWSGALHTDFACKELYIEHKRICNAVVGEYSPGVRGGGAVSLAEWSGALPLPCASPSQALSKFFRS